MQEMMNDHSTSELVESGWRPRSVGDIGSETEQGPEAHAVNAW